MTKKKNLTAFMIAIMVMLFSLPANAQGTVGYVEWDEVNTTLTFKGGTSRPYGAYALNTDSINPGWNKGTATCTRVVFDASFKDVRPTSCYYWFNKFSNLSTIEGIGNLNTANVTNMDHMFAECSNLTSLDVSNFNTANVTNMDHMFAECSNLTSLAVSNFKTANVTDMSYMFKNCSKLTSLAVSNFKTANVTDMRYMFRGCSGLTSLDLSSFNTANVTDMSYMFKDCSDLTSLDLSSFNTAKVTTMYEMFANCSKLTSLDVSSFNTDNVTYMSYMFKDCSDLTSLDLSSFNTAKVTTMYYMFANCSKLTSLNVSKFNTAKVKNMEHMFYNCSTLTSLDVSNFNTANVTNMSDMFNYCSKLTSLDVSNFNTDNVRDMSYMFYNCSTLESLNVSKFNTANVTYMSYMFYNCSGLTSLDVSNFNTDNVRDMSYMFYKCSGLTTIYVSDDFKIGNNTEGLDMFYNCSKLVGAVEFDSNKKGKSMANYKTGYFKTYYKLGNDQVDLYGDKFAVESLTLSDDKNFVAHAPFKANSVSYTREITSNSTWYTLCLPFAYNTTPQNFTAYKLKSATDNSVEIEQITGEITAGTPIIFKFNGDDKNIYISVSNADIENDPGMASTTEGNGCQLYGTYQEKTFSQQDNNTFIIYKDRLMNPANMPPSVTKVGVRPFHAYMTMTSQASASAKSFSIGSGDEGTTAIDLLNSVATDDAEYYDINGRRIDAPAKGVNIVRRGNKTMKLIIK